jgi:hypothetical protein
MDPPETISCMQGDLLQIYLCFAFFCELLKLYRVSVGISFFQFQQLPEDGAPSYLLTVPQEDLFLVHVGLRARIIIIIIISDFCVIFLMCLF